MRRFQCIILVASVGLLAVSAAPLTDVNTKPSKAVSGGGGSDRDHLLAPIDNAIKTESAEEEEQRQRNFFLPQSLVPPPPAAAAKADVKQSKKPKVVDPDNREFVTGHRIPPEIIERRNKAAAYVDSSSFRQEAVASPLPPPSLSSPLLDYALLSDEGDHAFFSTRDSFVPDYEFEY